MNLRAARAEDRESATALVGGSARALLVPAAGGTREDRPAVTAGRPGPAVIGTEGDPGT
ncbi:hypothetical protein GCM10020295_45510 [Streptomyces cinereospinus]